MPATACPVSDPYLRLHRLHGIGQELLGADPSQTTISARAAAWGILNPGHFARQYTNLFGEQPSDTVFGHDLDLSCVVIARSSRVAASLAMIGRCWNTPRQGKPPTWR